MTRVQQIYETLCDIAPLELQADFDNAGFLLGHGVTVVSRVLLALDVTDAVIDEAIKRQAQLIVSHHPLIFRPLKSVTDASPEGRRVLKLIENHIAVISMHTNLDVVNGGVNDVLIEILGAKAEAPLDEDGCGRIGRLVAPLPLQDFILRCKTVLHGAGLRYVDAGRPVERFAVMGGSGAGSMERAAALGCDTYVTADIKYHQFQAALDLGLNLIDAEHFDTENPVIYELTRRLQAAYPEIDFLVSAVHSQIIRFA